MDSSRPITVLLADTHDCYRHALETTLRLEDDFEIVAETGDSNSLNALISRTHPQILLMDDNVMDELGFSSIHEIKRTHNLMAVIIHSMYAGAGVAESAKQAGADAYVLKEMPVQRLLDTMHYVLREN